MRADRGYPPEAMVPEPGLQRLISEHDIDPVKLLALRRFAGGARCPDVRPAGKGERGYHIQVSQYLVEVPTDESGDRPQRLCGGQCFVNHR